eukprot:TRINITY_DN1838_c0_g1_i2.p1 TRINITY_DN1838_c0_g1~~TRINITY_DN1838_c0_g1_i2.p1  ORF type:complete len:693 (+),score=116.98 TRINITY_DN1838_c0_g1_i2:236-2080(+)
MPLPSTFTFLEQKNAPAADTKSIASSRIKAIASSVKTDIKPSLIDNPVTQQKDIPAPRNIQTTIRDLETIQGDAKQAIQKDLPAEDDAHSDRRSSHLGKLTSWLRHKAERESEKHEAELSMQVLTNPGKSSSVVDTLDFKGIYHARKTIAEFIRKASRLIESEDPEHHRTALRTARKAVSLAQATHGSGHAVLLPVLNVYTAVCLGCNLLPHCEKSLHLMDKIFESLDYETVPIELDPMFFCPVRENAVQQAMRVTLHFKKKEFQSAIDAAAIAMKQFESVNRDDNMVTLAREKVELTNAVSLYSLGRLDESHTQFKKLLMTTIRKYGKTSTKSATVLQLMSVNSLKMGNNKDAITLVSMAYKNLHKGLGESHPQTMSCMTQISEILLLTKQFTAATKWLVVLNRIYIDHLTTFGTPLSPLNHARALHLLSLAYLGLNKAEQALQVANHSVLKCQTIHELGYSSEECIPLLTNSLSIWCTAYRKAGRYTDMTTSKEQPVIITRLEGLLGMSQLMDSPKSRETFKFYALLHLSHFHAWMGQYPQAEAYLEVLNSLEDSTAKANREIWKNDLDSLKRVLVFNDGWPDSTRGTWLHSVCGFIPFFVSLYFMLYQSAL